MPQCGLELQCEDFACEYLYFKLLYKHNLNYMIIVKLNWLEVSVRSKVQGLRF